ncbi:MAG: hypothetical protein AB7O52_17400 [Planctomycetota bacterium]
MSLVSRVRCSRADRWGSVARSRQGWFRGLVFVGGLLLGLGSLANAQTMTGWERRVESVQITPGSAAGLWDVTIYWTAATPMASAPANLSTNVEVHIASGIVFVDLADLQANPGPTVCASGPPCAGTCGSGAVNGIAASLLCSKELPCGGASGCSCECKFPPIAIHLSDEPLAPGDPILVVLSPASGAEPNASGGDTLHTAVFDGEPTYTNRRLDLVELVPSSTGGQDVLVHGHIEFVHTVTQLDLSTEVAVYAGPNLISLTPVELFSEPGVGACFGQSCGSNCGNVNGLPANCDPSHFIGCGCGFSWQLPIPLPPGFDDDIVVTLQPLPGSLPELPGLEGDDEGQPAREFIRGDCNVDTSFNIGDAIFGLSALFGGQAAPQPVCDDACDANDDGSVDIADMISMLNGLFGSPATPPPAPHPGCGVDPTGDGLDCGAYGCPGPM